MKLKHTLVTTMLMLFTLFTFIDARDYRAKRSTEFYDLVSNPVAFFRDNRTYYREIKQHGLPDERRNQIRSTMSNLNLGGNIFATKISSSQKSKGSR